MSDTNSIPRSKIVFFMSGSIAAFKACQLLSRLVQAEHDVQVVASPSAFQFVGHATLEGLTGKKVLTDLWEPGHAMDHIHLSRWADFGLICPATAQTIAKVSMGLSDDLLSATLLAWPKDKPLGILPAMNSHMLNAPPTEEHLRRLIDRGFKIAPTAAGSLACGEEGDGRLLEVPETLRWIAQWIRPPLGRILLTSGATREPIDGIRYLSNVSTGQTAARLAELLNTRGWQVTYLHGKSAILPTHASARIEFNDFSDLNDKLQSHLRVHEYQAVIHAAAVSDFSALNARPQEKLSSENELSIQLKRNFKILPRLREYSRNPAIRVVGFKLTMNHSTADSESAGSKILSPQVDAIVTNDWSRVDGDRKKHPGSLVRAGLEPLRFEDLPTLASHLHELIFDKGEA